jgi:hypothetical protein
MTLWERFEHTCKWFYMKYIGKYLSAERILTRECIPVCPPYPHKILTKLWMPTERLKNKNKINNLSYTSMNDHNENIFK